MSTTRPWRRHRRAIRDAREARARTETRADSDMPAVPVETGGSSDPDPLTHQPTGSARSARPAGPARATAAAPMPATKGGRAQRDVMRGVSVRERATGACRGRERAAAGRLRAPHRLTSGDAARATAGPGRPSPASPSGRRWPPPPWGGSGARVGPKEASAGRARKSLPWLRRPRVSSRWVRGAARRATDEARGSGREGVEV